jgi:hypothetical protein
MHIQKLLQPENIASLHSQKVGKKKYAYQEWPHPAHTASPHSQKVERSREHGYTIISFKIDATNN